MNPRPLPSALVNSDRPTGARRVPSCLLPALLASLLVVAGCSQGGASRQATIPANPEMTSDGLALARETPRSKLWVKPDHHLGRYDDILIAGIAFAYGKGQTRLKPDEEKRVRQLIAEAVSGIADGSVIGRSMEPGPCVVALEIGLKDMYLHIGEAGGSSQSFVSSFGSATMIIEFRDSTTNVPLVRYAVHRGLGGGSGAGQVGANMARLGSALGKMMTSMTNELQQIVPSTTVRGETECNDGIYKLTGRG